MVATSLSNDREKEYNPVPFDKLRKFLENGNSRFHVEKVYDWSDKYHEFYLVESTNGRETRREKLDLIG